MTFAPPRPCARCGRLVLGRRCTRCDGQYDKARGTAHARGYTREWSAYARAWLARFPWCGQRADGQLHIEHSRCAQRGERVRAEVVDHVVPMVEGGASMAASNSQSLCTSCNTAKGIADRKSARAAREAATRSARLDAIGGAARDAVGGARKSLQPREPETGPKLARTTANRPFGVFDRGDPDRIGASQSVEAVDPSNPRPEAAAPHHGPPGALAGHNSRRRQRRP
jgi:5-methylcytosine-specific restriction protein A